MFAGTDLEYHIRDRQVIIRKAISREETRPIVMQQDKVTVKGIVTDAKGEAIIGANIIEKGTTNGTITDIDGRFTLVVSEKSSLVFSYIGYLTQEMLVGKKTFLNVQLQEDNKTLDEVVITGYGGTQLRSKMTNSIAKVDNSTLSLSLIHISEPTRQAEISYAVFCLKKKKNKNTIKKKKNNKSNSNQK